MEGTSAARFCPLLWAGPCEASASQACPLEVWFDGAGSTTFVHY
jgi:hypothetical protein